MSPYLSDRGKERKKGKVQGFNVQYKSGLNKLSPSHESNEKRCKEKK